jgi:hypothetical protein
MNEQPPSRIRVSAFIDSQNLNLGVASNIDRFGKTIYQGWKLDYTKFRRFLADKYKVETASCSSVICRAMKACIHTCSAQATSFLKLTTVYKDDDGQTRVKGNVDTDLVCSCGRREINNFDRAVIVLVTVIF